MLRDLLFAALFATAPAVQVRVDAPEVDPAAVRRGLQLRLGEASHGWVVEIRPTRDLEVVHLRLESPHGDEVHRSITLDGQGEEERSRELASAVTLIIEGHGVGVPGDRSPERRPPEETVPTRGWVTLGPRVGLGPPSGVDPDYGLAARGGVWLLGEHVQPMISLGWSRSARRDLVLDGVRFGAGAAFGAPLLGRRLWVGAGVVPHAVWTRAEDRQAVAEWRSSTEVAALLQVRGPWWLLGARAGLDLTLPPVRAVGHDTALRWGVARFVMGLELGLVLPPMWNFGPSSSRHAPRLE